MFLITELIVFILWHSFPMYIKIKSTKSQSEFSHCHLFSVFGSLHLCRWRRRPSWWRTTPPLSRPATPASWGTCQLGASPSLSSTSTTTRSRGRRSPSSALTWNATTGRKVREIIKHCFSTWKNCSCFIFWINLQLCSSLIGDWSLIFDLPTSTWPSYLIFFFALLVLQLVMKLRSGRSTEDI